MRIKRAVNAVKKRRKIFKLAKGYWGSKKNLYRVSREAVMKSMSYAYVGRKLKKRDFRRLWIARINAAARINGISPFDKILGGLAWAISASNVDVDIDVFQVCSCSLSPPCLFS